MDYIEKHADSNNTLLIKIKDLAAAINCVDVTKVHRELYKLQKEGVLRLEGRGKNKGSLISLPGSSTFEHMRSIKGHFIHNYWGPLEDKIEMDSPNKKFIRYMNTADLHDISALLYLIQVMETTPKQITFIKDILQSKYMELSKKTSNI